MIKVKGVAYETLRTILKKKDNEFKENYYALLPEEERDAVQHALSISWKPLQFDEDKNCIGVLAKLLYPNDPLYLQKLGYEMSRNTIPRFYQIFIRIPSIEYIFKRVAKIWGSFYDTGEAHLEDLTDSQFYFVLKNFPNYPAFLREYMCGYLKGMGELLNLKNTTVKKIEKDPNEWKWEVRWGK